MAQRRRSQSDPAPVRGFDRELEQLESLALAFRSGQPLDPPAIELLRHSLAHRNNYLVSKAARLAGEAALFDLLPQLLTACERFFEDAAKTDPQCWAKNELVRAMQKLEHRQKDIYLRGLQHHQPEAVWGGQTDTAGPLRAACCHALIDCPGLADQDLLALLVEALVDTDTQVRLEAARAIGRVGGPSAALVLRLRARIGRDEPEVMGAVFSALAAVEADAAAPVLALALDDSDLAAEAAFALSELRSEAAFEALRRRFLAGAAGDLATALLSSIALTRQPQADEFLLGLIEQETRSAAEAIEAVTRSVPSPELAARLEQAVRANGSPRLLALIRE